MVKPTLETTPPTNKEILAELKSKACATVQAKKELVRGLVEYKEAIVAEINRVDINTADRMEKAIPTADEFKKTKNDNSSYFSNVIYLANASFGAFMGICQNNKTNPL